MIVAISFMCVPHDLIRCNQCWLPVYRKTTRLAATLLATTYYKFCDCKDINLVDFSFGWNWKLIHIRCSDQRRTNSNTQMLVQTYGLWYFDPLCRGHFYWRGLTLNPAWISNHTPSKLWVWDKITCPFPNFNGATVEVWEWISNFIPHFIMYIITYPGTPYQTCFLQSVYGRRWFRIPWWRHQLETFSALLAFCKGNSPVTSEFPSQRPVTRSFDVFFLRLNKQWNKQSDAGDFGRHRAHYDAIVMLQTRWRQPYIWSTGSPEILRHSRVLTVGQTCGCV